MQSINIIRGFWKEITALVAMFIGFTVVAMFFMSIYYNGRMEEMHKAHRAEITVNQSRHTRENNKITKEISNKIDEVKILVISGNSKKER